MVPIIYLHLDSIHLPECFAKFMVHGQQLLGITGQGSDAFQVSP